jgi:hypothetical protein
MITYEQMLDRNPRWALLEGSMHFEKNSAVFRTLEKISQRLEQLRIPYAVAGGLALFLHGFRRFTEDVDLLVTREGLKEIHAHLEGLGYLPPFAGSKNLRDAESGVRIEFLVSGEYPGDGKPKPVAFPDPAEAQVAIDGIQTLTLPRLIELKLASGLTNALRGQDIIDVQRLIQTLQLPASLAEQLSPFVRAKYLELWTLIQTHPSRPE